MTEYAPVVSVADYRSLDEGEVLEGYLDGICCGFEPGSARSRAYWHGWLNGRVDAGLASRSPAQLVLNEAFKGLGRTLFDEMSSARRRFPNRPAGAA